MEIKANQYQCELCGNVYDKGRTDEEALAETKNNFGEIPETDLAVVCDDCYNQKIKPTFS